MNTHRIYSNLNEETNYEYIVALDEQLSGLEAQIDAELLKKCASHGQSLRKELSDNAQYMPAYDRKTCENV